MMVKKDKPLEYYQTVKPTDNDFCCQVNPKFRCGFCKKKLCADCGRAWSGRQHFILNLCHTRFTPQEIKESKECYKKRITKDGQVPSQLGNCKVCNFARTIARPSPIPWGDRLLIKAK